MIVVINPSAKAGQSFKGLHAYCSHDTGRAKTSERVDWISMRNLAVENPDKGWRVMAATAYAQNELKRANNIRPGRAPKDGAVMHIVMSYDQDEPTSQEQMEAAAHDLLSEIGADPARMRGKKKPGRCQFADEHQAIMYAHSDTNSTHVHIMVNRVHPLTGLLLPTNNDHNKAQNWALKYSKEHGTDHKTPARAENDEMRRNGEYVKAEKRKTRNAYEQDQQTRQASNDNRRFKDLMDEQRRLDAQLAKRGRDQQIRHDQAMNKLYEQDEQRKLDLQNQLKTNINKAKAEVREEYRPILRDLHSQLEAEKRTFEAMEESFIGRAANAFKTVFARTEDIGAHRHGFNVRRFNAAGNAGERKRIFEAAQERILRAAELQRDSKLSERIKSAKDAQRANMEENRARLNEEREQLKRDQALETERLKEEWRNRNMEREALVRNAPTPSEQNKAFEDKAKMAHARTAYRTEFDSFRQQETSEQDNQSSDVSRDDYIQQELDWAKDQEQSTNKQNPGQQIRTGEDAQSAGSLSDEYAKAELEWAKKQEQQSDGEQGRDQSDNDDHKR